jgi:hypothetical protein
VHMRVVARQSSNRHTAAALLIILMLPSHIINAVNLVAAAVLTCAPGCGCACGAR